jgi:hypothetical protein
MSSPSHGPLPAPRNSLSLKDAEEAGATIISCADDPFNLHPAVAGTLRRIEWARASLHEKQPLVVLLGEDHSAIAHKMFRLALLDGLISTGHALPFAHGCEWPHNMLGAEMNEKFGLSLTPAQKTRISASDRDGRHVLSVFLAVTDPANAPVATHTLFDFCRRRGISTRFNDVAKRKCEDTGLNFLDTTDPVTASLIARHARGWENLDIPAAYNALGIRLRNLAIVEQAMAHIADSHAAVYVQSCGEIHRFGHAGAKLPCGDGLSRRFGKAGADVLNVLIADERNSIGDIPLEARSMLADSLIITGLNAQKFYDGNLSEADFIRKLAARSAMNFQVFDVEDSHCARPALQQMVMEKAPGWLTNAGISIA